MPPKKSPAPTFFLPPNTDPPPPSRCKPHPGFHTYYLSCDPRSLAPYRARAELHFHKGFRAALLAPAGLSFDPNAITLVGLQDGDTLSHARDWTLSNPLREFQEHRIPQMLPPKEQARVQQRFEDAVCTLEGVAEAQVEAEAELEAATIAILQAQGTESIWIQDSYYDVSYNRERLFLKRRDPRFNPLLPSEEDEPVSPKKPKKTGKKASKRVRRVA